MQTRGIFNLVNRLLRSTTGRIVLVVLVVFFGWYAAESMFLTGRTVHDETYVLGNAQYFQVTRAGERYAITIGRSSRPTKQGLSWQIRDEAGQVVHSGRDAIQRKVRRVFWTPKQAGRYSVVADYRVPSDFGQSWLTIRAGDRTILQKFLSQTLGWTITR